MQMLSKVSDVFSDVHCPTCGQGFLVYWTRQRAGEREQQKDGLQQALRDQHGAIATADAHAPAFQVPDAPMPLPKRHRQAVSSGIPVYQ